jgi:hypothetical protein
MRWLCGSWAIEIFKEETQKLKVEESNFPWQETVREIVQLMPLVHV